MTCFAIRLLPFLLALALFGAAPDWRRFSDGSEIPSEGYCDQPYVVLNPDGSWLCVMTTGAGRASLATMAVVQIALVVIGWAIGLGRFGAVVGPALAGYLIAAGLDMSMNYYLFAVPMAIGGLLAWRTHVR